MPKLTGVSGVEIEDYLFARPMIILVIILLNEKIVSNFEIHAYITHAEKAGQKISKNRGSKNKIYFDNKGMAASF